MGSSLWSAMEWWDEWKLRILVLCSISVQFFLAFSVNVRSWYCLRRLRVMVWIAYIGGDALAIYALATLFNRQTKQQSTSALEVIWAPVLLIHLGGQQLTAYSLEDNELWRRHVITLVSQITVALYVFCKWWSGEKKLLVAAVLLFVVGILRFCQRPCALWWASYDTLAYSLLTIPSVPTKYSQEAFVDKARQHVKERPPADQAASDQGQDQGMDMDLDKEFVRMFVGRPAPYYVRLQCLRSFLKVGNGSEQHQKLRLWTQMQFVFTYTKLLSLLANNNLGGFLAIGLRGLTLASVVLFAKSVKNGYNKSDIMVTYILFSATVVIEFASDFFDLLVVVLMSLPFVGRKVRAHGWPDMVSQYNIMVFIAQNKTKRKKKNWMMMMLPTTLMAKLDAASSYLRNYILIYSKHWDVWHVPAAEQISVLVRLHAEYGWKEYIGDPATYRIFNNLRGEHTLRKHNLLEELGWAFDDVSFDLCVLVWHLATDLCLHGHPNPSGTASSASSSSISQPGASESRRNSEIISNHMIYLLFMCPEMLMPGTRPLWFMVAFFQIEAMIKEADELSSSSLSPLDATSQGGIARHICRVIEGGDQDLSNRAPLIVAAYNIAKLLITTLKEETERWDVIQAVWVEMLCYSASRSRAYDHAKSLAHGGEYLTSAWLIWSCMGMETFADRMQFPGPPQPDPPAAEQPVSAAAAAAAE